MSPSEIVTRTQKGTFAMSSLLTNSTAMTALQTLRSVSSQLSTTQNRISTGQRVSTASDNAAYWSIATSMRADNAALSAVSDSLGLSAATVDTEYTALTSVVGDSTGGLTKLQSLRRQEPHLDQHGLREVADGLGGSRYRPARRRRHEPGVHPLGGSPGPAAARRSGALDRQQQQPEHPVAVSLSLKQSGEGRASREARPF